jgi:PKD repeat protein
VATHVYAAAGSYQVTLTVDEFGVGSDSSTRTVRAYATNSAPTLGGLDCGSLLAANTWVASMTDASVDPDATPPSDGIKQVTMNWGDGTMLDVKAAAASFSHTYKNAAPIGCKDNVTGDKIPTLTSKAACEGAGEVWGRTYYVVTHTAVDNTGKKASETCRVSPLPFSIGGAITRLVSGVPTAVASATVTISGGGITRTVYSAANGTFSVSGLKPGTYNIAVSKSGLTFPGPESPDPDPATGTTVTVGPSRTAVAISAL